MKILRTKTYSLKSTIKTMFKGAIKELGKEYEDEIGGEIVFGVLPIDRFVDKSRFLDKNCTFKVKAGFEVEGNADPRSIIFWDLDYDFEPTEACPREWKSFLITGTCKDKETMDASVICKDGKALTGRVMIELR